MTGCTPELGLDLSNLQRRVVSVSRRTDIPAWFGDAFVEKVKAGSVHYLHPYTREQLTVSLDPDDVSAFVFWSKNYEPFLTHIPFICDSYNALFHFTITGLPSVIEPYIPSKEDSVRTFQTLSRLSTPKSMIWRYDPILLSDTYNFQYHARMFSEIAESLAGYTDKCYISYIHLYSKIRHTVMKVSQVQDTITSQDSDLLYFMKATARANGMELFACCSPDMLDYGVRQAHCVDKSLLELITGTSLPFLSKRPTRSGCGCYASVDIGSYGTCRGGCIYCYAK
ncbi:MAG: DUF1848 domain-containing protein [Candidatus Auribacter fodinae]|jgi:hypothetical protein|uniref:DUF1848 domain-containing protein n=1 Tax=Candidatus Auribacter fodinae TaxID=2093366 RepID=A0A3A4R990_9BACT|nr:MAG: DUF1848 domain-containing protein [Candidatus Auribacter fodinae]